MSKEQLNEKLFEAVYYGPVDIVKFLIEKGTKQDAEYPEVTQQ